MADMVIPDSIDPVIGWRAWRIRDARLVSVHQGNTVWPLREALVAECASRKYFYTPGAPVFLQRHEEPAPHAPCKCGIYAAKNVELAQKLARYSHLNCLGRVALWGKVIEYEHGWRGQFAYPVELVLFDGSKMWSDQAVDLLGLTYGVPVRVEGRR